jgi:hypothetical protein
MKGPGFGALLALVVGLGACAGLGNALKEPDVRLDHALDDATGQRAGRSEQRYGQRRARAVVSTL